MNELRRIKKRILDENKVEELLEAIGCEYIHPEQRGLLITAQLPMRFNSDNKRAVQVKLNDYISCAIRNRGFNGSIFELISYIVHNKRDDEIQNDLPNAINFVCEIFGWHDFKKGKKGTFATKDYTACLKEIMNSKQRRNEVKPNPVLDEKVLNEFYFYGKPLPYQKWIEEGISYKTQMLYGIGFDLESKRITIPMRNRFGKLVGVKGRIMNDEDDDRKYLYLYRFLNSNEWFNWHVAHQYILIDKKVYIFEGEKSPMKGFEFGIYNTISVGASDISEFQAQMVKQLGLDVEIVLCYDKGINIEEIKKQAKLFEDRKVYAIYDTDNLLEDKMSPIDNGLDVWEKLVSNYCFEIKV